jgi:hypothetical protein
MDADQRLAGNMAVSGKDGRYGAKLYWRSGASEQFLSGYSSMSQGVRDIYDMIFSVLTDQPYLHRKEGQSTAAVGNRVYGSSDLSVTENALVSRRTGQTSGIVVCSPTTEPDESQMTLWVDLDCPEVTAVRQSEDGTQRTVVLCFDEPIQEGEGLANLTCVSAQTEGNRLILTLDSGTAGETLTIPADAVTDQVGRGMAEAYTVSLSQAAKLSTGESVQFSDVADGYWAVEAISAVSSAGLFRGVTDETFQPGGTLTRGMFVTVLGRMVGVEEGTVTSAFSDVADDAWYAPYVNWAAETGIVTGKADGIFAPEDAITREEMAVMLERFLTVCVPGALAEVSGLPFSDQDQVSDWAQEAVRTLESNGLMNGSDGAFRPKAEATRAEAAALLSRCMTWVMGE